ncbi:hypothetical protein ACH5RR_020143 [Cinchona calisaya]|uniref:BHLH domain-containing protein n=1 Tax=Cinchona calisaya TaxID=153742 RepID=A0ABD2ZEV0_9GENT
MEEEINNNYNAFPFTTTTNSTLAFGGSSSSSNPSCCFQEEAADQNHYFSNETTLHPWLYCQQTPQNYIEFLAENGASQFQKGLPFSSNSPGPSGFTTPETSFHMVGHKRPYTEGEPMHNNLSGSVYQIPSQNSNEGYSPAATGFPSTVPGCSTPKHRAALADRRRRLRISQGLDALQELLPHSTEGRKASVLDDSIDLIKYLQFQVKELSQSRLGGESSSTPFILLEGYGHYLLHDQMQNEPLEEMMGKLLEVNPLAATQLLESRGLLMMPMALAEELRPQN